MRSRRCFGVTTGALFLLAVGGIATAGVDQWDFSGGLSPSAGSGTLTVEAPGTITYTTAVIDGQTAQVASFAAGTVLRMAHGFPANGGGSYVNQYTLIMDVMFPDTTAGYASLFQTNLANSNDGDWFLKHDAGVGISGTYAGSVTDGVWHRFALVVDLAAGTYTSYVDGVQAMKLTLADESDLTVDGRWSLDPEALLFADNDGETAAGFINSIQFRDEALTAGAIATYGGPTAFGLPASVTVDFDQPDGPPVGWYIVQPNVTVESGVLALTPAGVEATALGGIAGEPIWFDSLQSLEFDLAYPGEPPDWPNDHGGVIFCCQNKANRNGNTGYLIDYLAGGFRCLEMPSGAGIGGNSGVTSYEGRWRIELTDTTIRFLLNGVEQFTVADARWRGGYVGFWDYTNAGQKMTVDNIVAEFTPAACPTLTPASVVGTVAGTKPAVGIRIPTLYNLPGPYEVTLASADPSVAAPVGHTGGSLAVTFEQFGPQTKYVEVESYKEGETQLGVAGEACDAVATRVEVWKALTYCEDFAQADGPPEDWSVTRGTVAVVGEQLTFGPPPGDAEIDVFAGQGGVASRFLATTHLEFDMAFPGNGTSWPYDHGGVIFCAQTTGGRYANPGSCYVVDYLPTAPGDNTGGRFRCSKFINGGEIPLYNPAPTPGLVYEGKWAIDLTATEIKFTFNGTPVFTVADSSYRDGYVGFWAYQVPAENKVAVDNFCIDSAVPPCPTISPATASNRPVNPKTVFTVAAPFGSNAAADYAVTVTSTQPAVAAPVGGTNGVLVLNFAAGGPLVQTFEAECLSPGTTEFVLTAEGAACPRAKATFTVPEPGVSQYCEDFEQVDGPPEGWTPYAGAWQVTGGKLTVSCAAGGTPYGETWIYAGSPPVKFEGAETYAFSVDLSQATPDGVGAHGGFMLFASAPRNRATISGYEIDWIDRAADHGYRCIRYDNGAAVVLVGGPSQPQNVKPGKDWVVEVDGAVIRLVVDGAVALEVTDPTYRDGYFGFWSFCNTTQMAIGDLSIGDCAAPTASFTATPETGAAPLEVAFDASASTDDVGIVSYAWDFGDAATGTGAQATHTYAAEGSYTVLLTVADAGGNVATATKVITVTPAGTQFRRGDADGSGEMNITDGIFILNFLFLGGPTPGCLEAANPNDDLEINITDGIYVLNFLFLGGPAPVAPTPECGLEPAGSPSFLGCDSYTTC